jgi:hypothetical protein
MKFTLALSVALLASAQALASSHRDLRNPVEAPTNIDVGPTINSDGSHGQYLRNLANNNVSLRTHEMYDDPFDNDASFIPFRIKDLWGQVIGLNTVDRSGVDHITGFKLRVTVRNDTILYDQPYTHFGITQLGERSSKRVFRTGHTMQDTMITMEFARLAGARPPQVNAGTDELLYNELLVNATEALTAGTSMPQIIALNPDATAWYGITPGSSRSGTQGDYIVPAYNFGTVPADTEVSRDIDFVVEGNGIPQTELRYNALQQSLLYWRYQPASGPLYIPPVDPNDLAELVARNLQKNQADVLFANSSDLKVGNYLDVLATDVGRRQSGATNFNNLFPNGNASIFYNIPEPTSVVLIASAGAVLSRRRR